MVKQNEKPEGLYTCESCGAEFTKYEAFWYGKAEPEILKCPWCGMIFNSEVKNGT